MNKYAENREYGENRKNRKNRKNGKTFMFAGVILIFTFVIWTLLILTIDVQPNGVHGTNIGFSTINCWFHKLTGVHMGLYNITDWLGLAPVFVCVLFGGVGLTQMIKRRSIFRVDYDILFLGLYYVVVMFCYIVFEMFPVNYRPILIGDFLEASYPSSTTMLVLCVMPTLVEQMNRRLTHSTFKECAKVINLSVVCFSAFMVIGRLVSGVHWLTDIVGAIILSAGLFCVYKSAVILFCKDDTKEGE